MTKKEAIEIAIESMKELVIIKTQEIATYKGFSRERGLIEEKEQLEQAIKVLEGEDVQS
jgi:hypothetical protein